MQPGVDVSFWIKSLDENCRAGISRVLVGNKSDLADARQVSADEGRALADKYGMAFFEASAKAGTNVENVFLGVGQDIIKKNPNIAVENANKMLTPTAQGRARGDCC